MAMNRRAYFFAASTVALAIGFITASPADAQTPAASETPGRGDIVVTARREEESIQSVPVSVTAFSAETLRENSVRTPEDLQIATHGVYLSGNSGRKNQNFENGRAS